MPGREGAFLPSIGQVVGWRVYVYALDHPLPHIHLRKAGQNVSLSLDGTVLEGALPAGDLQEVRRWIEAKRAALLAAFNDVQQGRVPKPIR